MNSSGAHISRGNTDLYTDTSMCLFIGARLSERLWKSTQFAVSLLVARECFKHIYDQSSPREIVRAEPFACLGIVVFAKTR